MTQDALYDLTLVKIFSLISSLPLSFPTHTSYWTVFNFPIAMPFYILFAWPGMEAYLQTPRKHRIPWFLSHCEVSCTSLDSDSIHVQMPLYCFIYWIFIMYQVLLNLGCSVVNKIDKSPALKFYKIIIYCECWIIIFFTSMWNPWMQGLHF